MARARLGITATAVWWLVIAVAAPAAAQPGGTFVDDDGNHHEGMIEAIFAAGITLGCDPAADNLYCPSDLVTRGQMASFLVRALELSGGSDAFDDDDGSIHETAINALAAAGITEGCASDKFCPSDPVTRDQMASFLTRGYQLAPSATDFFDDDDGNIHEDAINALAASGITEGCGATSYCPRSSVERDQMASFLGRAEGLTAAKPPLRRIGWQLHRGDGSCALVVNGIELSEISCQFGGLSWSPDGERLVFPIDDDLWLIDRTGDNLTQLTSQPGFEAFPDWSPDGARIAFIRFADVDDIGDLHIVDADGGNDLLLVAGVPKRAISMPDWSPDGTLLAVNGFDTQSGGAGIFTVDAVSGAVELVVEGVGGGPDWSTDGNSILSTRIIGPRLVITRVAADGSGSVDLTDASFSSAFPGWSANGNQVVFTTHLPNSPAAGPYNVWIMKAAGTGMFRYTYYEDASTTFPKWAP